MRMIVNIKNKFEEDKFPVVCAGVFILLVTFIVSLQSPLNILIKNGNVGTDSSVFQTVAMYMENGFMPYKDIFDHKGPLLYVINWLGFKINESHGIWIIEVLALLCTFFMIYKTARLFCNRFYSCLTLLASSAALFIYFEGGNMTEEYAMPFIAVSFYIFADYFLNQNISRLRLIVCGLSFGAICMLRINMAAIWVVFCAAVLVDTLRMKKMKDLLYFICFFLVGVLLIILPLVIWLIRGNAFQDFINDYFVFNSAYISDGVRASWRNRYTSLTNFFYNPLVLLSAAYAGWSFVEEKSIFYAAYVIAHFFTLLCICMSGQTYGHYGMILIPLIALSIARIMHSIETQEKKKKSAVFIASAYVLIIFAAPMWARGMYNILATSRSETVDSVVDVVKEYTEEDETIMVYGNWNIIYILSERLASSKYSYQFPPITVDESIADEYFEELEENNPTLIIVQASSDLTGSENARMASFIEDNYYELLTEIDDVEIYTKQE